MFRFKKAGSFLSILTVVSVVAGTFPVQVFAEIYTGELQLPNTQVVNDYRQSGGYGQATLNQFNNSYFASAPSSMVRDSNNFITSLPQRIFSTSIRDGVLNCTSNDVNINSNNNSISLTYIAQDTNNNSSDPLCLPARTPLTAQNTALTQSGSGNSYGGLGVVQTYDALPVLTLGEAVHTTAVESIPNDPDNVRVTISSNATQEAYGLRFERRGDVERVLSGDYRLWFEDNGFYQDGKTYVINWTSNWVGQVPIALNDDYGTVLWGDPSTASYSDDSGRMTLDPLYVNTGYPTPQIVQLTSVSPSASESVIRPRNSDVLNVTQPQCRRWSDGNFWRTVQHIYCQMYALSADGRRGHAEYYNSASSSGWFQEALGVATVFLGAVTLGNVLMAGNLASGGFSLIETLTSALNVNLPMTLGLDFSLSSLYNAFSIGSGVAAANTLVAATVATAAVIAGASAFGNVDSTIASSGYPGQEGVWSWRWDAAPGFQETTDVVEDNDLCLNIEGIQTTVPDGYTRDPANGACTRGVCPNGATNYPVCTVVNTCVDPAANNFGRSLPCTYDPGRKCEDPAAINFNGALPCRYRPIICPANLSYCGTGANANKLCRRTYGSAPQCNLTESCAACSYGCADSACIPTPPSPEITGWQVAPLLLRSGESTFVSWNATDVSDCAVSGTNGDSWSGTTGTRKQSSAILGQTTFSISCSALSGASPATVSTTSKTVNIIPTFQER